MLGQFEYDNDVMHWIVCTGTMQVDDCWQENFWTSREHPVQKSPDLSSFKVGLRLDPR